MLSRRWRRCATWTRRRVRASSRAWDTQDEQRAFQLLVARIVAEGGVQALATKWGELPSPEWRATLASEIGQHFDRWVDEGTLEVLLAALEDEDSVARQALGTLIACLEERTPKWRKQFGKTQSGQVALKAFEQGGAWMTPARRARAAKAVTAALARCRAKPMALLWPSRYIELLGLSATRADADAIAVLESLRPMAGQTHRAKVETLDPDNLPWHTALVAEKKGIPPGTPFKEVTLLPTGLLDLENLELAIKRIRARVPEHAHP